MPVTPTSKGNNAGVLVDCVVRIVGWFQISGILDPSSGNYLPETNPDGSPVSGPGWTAYQKAGAQPGDIVVIYTLNTSGISLPASISIGSVLWDLVSPNGLSYYNAQYMPKIGINRSDIISGFPHAGNPFAPVNLQGYSDLIWTKVTSYYGLPGPGNTSNTNFIRRAIPEFGIRIVVWTDSCCVASQVTTKPPSPPVITTPVPINPGYNVPPITPPTIPNPGEASAGEFATDLRNSNSIVEQISQGNRYGVSDLGPGDGSEGSLPRYAQPTKVTKSATYIPRTQGSSQGVFNYGDDYQSSVYDAEGYPLGFRSRTGTQDSYVVRRASHVGSSYMYKKNKLISSPLIARKSTRYSVTYPKEYLDALGISSTAAISSDSLRVAFNRPPINTTNGSSFALPEYKGSQESVGTSQTEDADIAIRKNTNHYILGLTKVPAADIQLLLSQRKAILFLVLPATLH
jgi:hypothetical protein